MSTNTKPTIPTLLAEWGQMTIWEREYAIRKDVLGHTWRVQQGDEYDWDFGTTSPNSLYVPTGEPEWLDLSDTVSVARNLSVGCLITEINQRFTSEDSPRSLSKGVKAKVIEKVGEIAYAVALCAVMGIEWISCDDGNPMNEYLFLAEVLAVHQATADQEMCACWLAVKMEGMEGA